MATKIVTKNSSTASAVPTASDLVQGELAVNVADKRLFTEDNGGSIVELGTNPSTIDINAGTIDGTAIGASSASTGAFTTLTATGLTVDTDTLYVDSTNNRVGIGTTSPDANLVVYETATSGTDHFAQRWRTQSGGVLSIACSDLSLANPTWQIRSGSSEPIAFNQASNERMRIDASGNVGIGTSSPNSLYAGASNLVVGGGSSESGMTIFSSDTTDGNIYFADGTSGSAYYSGFLEYNHSSDFFRVGVNGSERMRIDASGKVGIGTSSPSAPLDVDGSGTGIDLANFGGSAQTNFSKVNFNTDALSSQAYIIAYGSGNAESGNVAIKNTNSSGDIFFTAGNTERMRIDSSGNVGIGTSSPSVPVHASGKIRAQKSGQASAYVQLSANEVTSNYAADIFLNDTGLTFKHNSNSRGFVFDQNGTERLRIDSSGNLLVGRTSTAGSLTDHGHQLYNSGLYYLYSSATGNSDAFRMYDGNGTLRATIDGDGDYTDLSDVRAKENIVNAPSVLSTINDLQVRSFTWKVDGKHQTYGFVAQELNEAIPEAVSLPEEEDGMWGVKHAKLVPVLVKAIQEQQTLIESLTDRIAALEE